MSNGYKALKMFKVKKPRTLYMVILFCNLILRTLDLYHSVTCQILLNQCKIYYLKSIQFTFTYIHKGADNEKNIKRSQFASTAIFNQRTLSDQKIQMSDQFYDLSDILSDRFFCRLKTEFCFLKINVVCFLIFWFMAF